jgi:hypothetical protein
MIKSSKFLSYLLSINILCSRFQTTMILTENDRKCFSLTYTRRTIRLQLNLLNESENHQSAIETLNAIRCLLLLVTHDNVHLIDFNQLGSILDK